MKIPTQDPGEVGQLPLRTELTVMPADDPTRPSIGLVVKEQEGFVISKLVDGKPIEFQPGEDLTVGQEILVPSPFSIGCYFPMTVVEEEGGLYGLSTEGSLLAFLQVADDERGAVWVCIGTANAKNLKSLVMKT